MSFAILGFILDIVVLAGLAATIYFTIRLSRNLNVIRNDKKALAELIATLSKNVDHANTAIINMRATATKTAENLQSLVNQAKSLSEELQIMNEAGNSLAERLERSVSKNPKPAGRTAEHSEPVRPPAPFFIHDRDYEAGSDNQWEQEDKDFSVPEELQTQAERELYAALRKNQKKSPASGRH